MKRLWAVVLLAALGIGCKAAVSLNGGYYQCDADAGADAGQCAQGWRCGLENYCHPLDAGFPYQCRQDPDCEHDWRCGPDGRCVDPSNDALTPGRFDSPQVTRLNPRLWSGTPALLAVSEFFNASPNFAYPNLTDWSPIDQSVAVASKGTLSLLVRFGTADTANDVLGQDAGTPYPVSTVVATAPIQTTARALVASGFYPHALDDQGLMEMTWTLDGGTSRHLQGPSAFASRLLVTGEFSYTTPLLFVYGNDKYVVREVGSDASTDVRSFPGLTDLVSVFYPAGVVALADGGLYYAPRDETGFLVDGGSPDPLLPDFRPMPPLALKPAPEGGGAPPDPLLRPVRLRAFDQRFSNRDMRLAVEATPLDGGSAHYLAVVLLSKQDDTDELLVTPEVPPYAPCDGGESLADVDLFDVYDEYGEVTYQVEALCRSSAPDGGRLDRRNVSSCSSLDYICDGGAGVPGPATLTAHSPGGRISFADVYGRVYLGQHYDFVASNYSTVGFDPYYPPQVSEPYYVPITLDRAPASFFGMAPMLQAYAPRSSPLVWQDPVEQYAQSPAGMVPRAQLVNGVLDSNNVVSFVAAPDPGPVANVVGAPDWLVSLGDGGTPSVTRGNPDGGARLPVAQLPPVPELALGPFQARVVDAPGGKKELLFSAFDTLLDTDVTDLSQGTPRTLSLRLVPLSRAAITSLDVEAGGDGGSFLSGYVVAGERVFHWTAATPSRWQSQEVTVPPGEALAVWADGARGRVGMRDGTVYALPSGVSISSPLPEPSPSVQAYAHVCGQAFALGTRGLYRLVPSPTSPLGTWTEETALEAQLLGSGDPGYEGGRLQAQGDTLYVVTGTGNVAMARVPGCK